MVTIAVDRGALAPELPARWEGVARWLRGDGSELAFLWQLSVRDAVHAGLDVEQLDLAVVRRALTYAAAAHGAVSPTPGQRITILPEHASAALASGRGATLMERVADVPEHAAQRAWLVNAHHHESQSLLTYVECYLRLEHAVTLARSLPPAVPDTHIWEVRAFGNLTYCGANLADPALPDWERYEVPLVRASKARVLGLAP